MAPQTPGDNHRNHLENAQRNEAWKYLGYPGFSGFMASSTDCFAVRKFRHLNVRVLLKLQNDIVKLERKLRDMDLHSMTREDGKGGCASFRLDENTPREELLDLIAERLKDYNERLNQFLQVQDRPDSSLEQVSNLRTWLSNYPNAIEEKEQEFIRHEEDLVVVRTAQRTHFGRWMESMGLSRIARPSGPASNGSTWYYDRAIWKSIGAFGLLVLMLMMLLGPLWSLPFAVGSAKRLIVVTAFTLAFSLFVIVGTTLKGFQRLVLVAGYFMQLILVLGLAPAWANSAGGTGTAMSSSASLTIVSETTATITSTATPTRPGTTDSTPTSSTVTQTSSATGSARSTLRPGVVAGIVVGICVVVLFMGSIIWFWFRRRKCHDREALLERQSPVHSVFGRESTIKRSGAVRSSSRHSRMSAKVKELGLGRRDTRQEAMSSQILEMPQRRSCLELENADTMRQSLTAVPHRDECISTPNSNAHELDQARKEVNRFSFHMNPAGDEDRSQRVLETRRTMSYLHGKENLHRDDTRKKRLSLSLKTNFD